MSAHPKTLVALLACGWFLAAAPAQGALTGYWPLDTGSGGTAFNAVGGGTDGTINNYLTGGLGAGGAAWITTDPQRGTVVSFNGNDGSGAYVAAGTIPQTEINGNFTWSFWANLQSADTGGNDVVVGNRFGGPDGKWVKFTRTNFEWRPGGSEGNVNIADIPFDGNWEHHAIVKAGTHFQYYLNGVPGASANFSGTFTGAVPFFIGGDAGGERPAGYLDDVATWNEALAASQVAYLAGGGNPTTVPSPPPTQDITLLQDAFPSGGVNPAKWNVINKGLESTVDGGYNAPSTAGDVLTLGGTTTHSYWAGKTLQSVGTFSTSEPTSFVVDRVSLGGSGIFRSSIWLWSDDNHFLHFSQNIGENGWQYNWNDVGGLGGQPAGSAVNIPGLDFLDSDAGLHEMMLKYVPGALPGEALIEMYVDGNLYASRNFTNWTPTDFQVLITGQARASGDSVSAVFDNARVFVTRQIVDVPEPATALLAALGLAGLGGYARRRRRRA